MEMSPLMVSAWRLAQVPFRSRSPLADLKLSTRQALSRALRSPLAVVTVSAVREYRQLKTLLILAGIGLAAASLYGCYQGYIGVEVVASQQERSQFQNKDNCMKMLRAKLVELQMQEKAEKISDLKGVQLKIEWGSQIRSYVFMPYQMVKDNRTGYETSNVNGVMDGDLDGFVNAYLKAAATGNWATK